jgi:hypothetical protein
MRRPALLKAAAALFAVVAALVITLNAALACASCSNRGSRYVEVEKRSERRLAAIGEMVFAKQAQRKSAEDDIDIPGMGPFGVELDMKVERKTGANVSSFVDRKGVTATLTLAIPKTISIFEVDPRGDNRDEGLGPNLYKEWKLTAKAAADGALKPAAGPGQSLTLILNGGGRGCTEAMHFTDWTLLLHGRAGSLTLLGALDSGIK